ncbi:MAG: type 12 methyltransferase [Parcubacteria group bacterium Greene0416_79]|nr:MAG: type 12 methyltransferase [Parcubacteria group bacterium Greene0416_79]
MNGFAVIRKKVRYDIKREVFACERCGFVFLRPLKKSAKDFYEKKFYRKSYGPVYSKSSTPREIFEMYYPFQKDIVQKIEPILRKDMKVLDVGCSTGHFLAALKGKVAARVGIELSKKEASFANRHRGFKVYDKPMEELALPEGPFDLITALQVLEHVEHPLQFLLKLKKNLKPEGYLYLELPNLNDPLLSYYKVAGYADFYYREPHLSYFTKKTLSMLLKKAGLRGKIGNVQRYNILNHLHWLATGKPQGDFTMGNRTPVLMGAGVKDMRVRKDFNDFIARADREYKKLIERNWLGESLTFLGRKRVRPEA